jgi:hypothetical protein
MPAEQHPGDMTVADQLRRMTYSSSKEEAQSLIFYAVIASLMFPDGVNIKPRPLRGRPLTPACSPCLPMPDDYFDRVSGAQSLFGTFSSSILHRINRPFLQVIHEEPNYHKAPCRYDRVL